MYSDFTQDCMFCSNNFHELQKEIVNSKIEDLILYEDDSVYVVADIAPLVIGHVLIVSKEHFKCYADSNAKVIDSLNKALEYMLNNLIYKDKYTFFEHGSMSCKKSGSCIDHAHFHLLPIDIDYNHLISFFDKSAIEFLNFSEIDKNENSYLLLGGENIKLQKIYAEFIPSQFMRMFIKSNIYEYRWKDSFKSQKSQELFIKTLDVLV